MYKLKTSKSILKRLKLKSKYKIFRHMACHNHLLQKKSSRRKQKLRKVVQLTKSDIFNFKFKIPYIS